MAVIVGNKADYAWNGETSMRALFLAAIGAVALSGLPAEASHWHVWPSFGFNYGFGPYPYYSPWGYGPSVGVGVHVGGPVGRQSSPAPAPSTQGALKLYVYPAAGQSAARTADDRYQCHVWAAGESGHDPTLATGSRNEAESYSRAFTACMEARNYVVR
jgi:hypothetical protein